MDFRIISSDDHVVEAPDIWTGRLPARDRDRGPRVVRKRILWDPITHSDPAGTSGYEESDDGVWADVWVYEDLELAMWLPAACAGVDKRDVLSTPILFDEMRPGCFRQQDRLADMDLNEVEASMCFPNWFTRFAGQRFLAGHDKDLALRCVRAYNDWMVEEWCAGSGGRLVPLCIVPLWDVALAAAEVRRNAARGVRAVTFTELPAYLDLPSIHSGYWDPFVEACSETDTVINLHLGSSGTSFTTSPDAPGGVGTVLTFVGPAMALADWILSGYFLRYPQLTVALAEARIGWLPYALERLDLKWEEAPGHRPVWRQFDRPPSSLFASNMFCSFIDERVALAIIDKLGVEHNFGFDNLTFEVDYPHSDSSWPSSTETAMKITGDLSEDVRRKLLRENAARQLRIPAGEEHSVVSATANVARSSAY